MREGALDASRNRQCFQGPRRPDPQTHLPRPPWPGFGRLRHPMAARRTRRTLSRALAYLTALIELAAGLALLLRRTVRAGALALAVVYSVFKLCGCPRLL